MFRKKQIIEKRSVLFVDDEEAILRSLKMGLLDTPYNQLFAKSGQEALEILKNEEVHVIVTDMRMPEMTGLELLRIAKKEYPHIIGVVLSGYVDAAVLQTAVEQGEIFKLIPKPWKMGGKFERLVRQALNHSYLQNERKTVRR
jgi:DNA-binding NtrC family response regulator